jgi:DNA-binding NtrC family response regulator
VAAANIEIPVIFITGHGDIPMSVQAMKAGAVDFLTKPFRDQDLLDAIQKAIQRDRARRLQESEGLGPSPIWQPYASRTRSNVVGSYRASQQADRSSTRHKRNHGEDSSGTRYAKNASAILGGFGAYGRV